MIITRTPLRISFIGGGTDLYEFYHRRTGEVISTAIDKYVYVIAKKRYDKKIYLNHSIKEIVDSVDEIQHELIREAMRKTRVYEGIEITTLSDIPAHGSGLGSSSSVTVGALNALYAYQGITKTAEDLAQEACEIEIGILGKPIGKQDQYIAAYGKLRHIQFNNDGSVLTHVIGISERVRRDLDMNTLLFYTGIQREASDILVEQKQNTDMIFDRLCKMNPLLCELNKILIGARGSIDGVGEILHQGWRLKRSFSSGISNKELDSMYEAACEAGALGGKLLGAGGGGFFLFYALPDKHSSVRNALSNLEEFPFNLASDGSKIIFNCQ